MLSRMADVMTPFNFMVGKASVWIVQPSSQGLYFFKFISIKHALLLKDKEKYYKMETLLVSFLDKV